MGIGVKFSFYSYSLWRAIFFFPIVTFNFFFFFRIFIENIYSRIYTYIYLITICPKLFF